MKIQEIAIGRDEEQDLLEKRLGRPAPDEDQHAGALTHLASEAGVECDDFSRNALRGILRLFASLEGEGLGDAAAEVIARARNGDGAA